MCKLRLCARDGVVLSVAQRAVQSAWAKCVGEVGQSVWRRMRTECVDKVCGSVCGQRVHAKCCVGKVLGGWAKCTAKCWLPERRAA